MKLAQVQPIFGKKFKNIQENNITSKGNQGKISDCDESYLSLSSLSFQHNIDLIKKNSVKVQRRTIYDMIF